VHHVEGRDVDEDAARPPVPDTRHEVVLQRDGETVVHVHLDGHQGQPADAEDGDALHGRPQAWRTTLRPWRFRARASASLRVALVVTSPSSTPRWTMVWAICGRIPLMMQSAPMRRAAA